MEETKVAQRSILMLPWLAHGHVSPFLQLAKKLSQRSFTIFFCSTPINLQHIREKTTDPSIKLIDLHLPHFPELPPHYHTTKDLPPHLMPLLKTAFDAAEASFDQLLRTLKPSLVIYDFLQPWAPSAALAMGIPAFLFLTGGGAANSFISHYSISSNTLYPFSSLTFPDDESQKVTGFLDHVSNGIRNGSRYMNCIRSSSSIVLIKTSREIESKYVDHLSELSGKRIATIGPLIEEREESSSAIMHWLDWREPASVVFVSFGSEYFLSRDQIEEVAHGLEQSNVGFIFVVRFHDEDRPGTIDEALPAGFLDRTRNRGMVVDNWAPQSEILSHSSIGGFVSHCGWSSILESITSGVPIIAMPMQLDQPLNAKLVVDIGVGMEVVKRDGKFRREDIGSVTRAVVVEESGRAVRVKAREVMRKMNQRGQEEIDEAVELMKDVIG